MLGTMSLLAITMGDPSGIGPEIVVNATRALDREMASRLVVFGDAGALDAAGGLPDGIDLRPVTALAPDDRAAGKPSAEGARAQVAYLEAAVAAAAAGEVAGIATAPINKTQVTSVGFSFPGHTEYLADAFGVDAVAMMFAGPRLKVVLATVHLALEAVPSALSRDGIARIARLANESLRRDFAVARPRVGVVGLNPHAGEGGLFGSEERNAIAPAVELLRGSGVRADGPLVPDAAFRDAVEGKHDVLVAMYHDQGLIPVKLVDFEEAVNVTLGLPIVRTSPDHGVAYDIAGRGIARATSMRCAVGMALSMIASRAQVA